MLIHYYCLPVDGILRIRLMFNFSILRLMFYVLVNKIKKENCVNVSYYC